MLGSFLAPYKYITASAGDIYQNHRVKHRNENRICGQHMFAKSTERDVFSNKQENKRVDRTGFCACPPNVRSCYKAAQMEIIKGMILPPGLTPITDKKVRGRKNLMTCALRIWRKGYD